MLGIKKIKFYGIDTKLSIKCNGLGVYYQFNNPYYYTIAFYLIIWRFSIGITTTKKRPE